MGLPPLSLHPEAFFLPAVRQPKFSSTWPFLYKRPHELPMAAPNLQEKCFTRKKHRHASATRLHIETLAPAKCSVEKHLLITHPEM